MLFFFCLKSILKLDHQSFCRKAITCQLYKFTALDAFPCFNIAAEDGFGCLVIGVESVSEKTADEQLQRIFRDRFQPVLGC